MIEISDVAATLIERVGALSTFQLQKLTYYVQAWHSTIYGEPLFSAEFEAWSNGPVAKELYSQYRRMNVVGVVAAGDPTKITGKASEIIDLVITHYGHLNGDELSAITHSESPWLEARGGIPDDRRSNNPISVASMIGFYSSKSLAGHSAAEIATIGANPVCSDEDAASAIVLKLLDSWASEAAPLDADLVLSESPRLESGFDPSNFPDIEISTTAAQRL